MSWLSDLFDYFTRNFGLGLYRQPHALRWLEAVDILDRKNDLESPHRDLVKTVGILNALGEFSHLRASKPIIFLAVKDSLSPGQLTRKALRLLRDQSVLAYRKFNETYRIWEGSDVDLEERISQGERKVRHALSLADGLRRYLKSRPLVARRHAFKTGALRYFEVLYTDNPDDVEETIRGETLADGKVVVCLAESTPVAEQFRQLAIGVGQPGNVLFAIPQQIGELRAVVAELSALRWAWENTPELRDDRVARRELSLRISETEQILLRNLQGLLDPRPEPKGSECLWFHMGDQQEMTSAVEVSHFLSTVCDQNYHKAPRIRNELITRRSLSSAASAARRILIERMLTSGDKPVLGIEGFPPERSMYESLLRAPGLHIEDSESKWKFTSPRKGAAGNLAPCWKHLSDLVFKSQPEPLSLSSVFKSLSAPPYGVLDGLHPVLLCAFMLVHADETTLYREGSFIPEPGIADFEVLMRRPELFAIAGSRVEGGRASVVKRLASGLQTKPATVPVVRALFRMTKGLPEFAWHTQRLPETTLALRKTFQDAKSPERFLFVEVPEALGLKPFPKGSMKQSRIDNFFKALNTNLKQWEGALPLVVEHARDDLLKSCGFDGGEQGWHRLKHEALRLEPSITEPQLLAFVKRIIQAGTDGTDVESVLALVANRPPHSWSDLDTDRFRKAAKTIGHAFRIATQATGPTNQFNRIYARLSRDEKEKAQRLSDRLRKYLKANVRGHSKKVIHAALALLVQEPENGRRK